MELELSEILNVKKKSNEVNDAYCVVFRIPLRITISNDLFFFF